MLLHFDKENVFIRRSSSQRNAFKKNRNDSACMQKEGRCVILLNKIDYCQCDMLHAQQNSRKCHFSREFGKLTQHNVVIKLQIEVKDDLTLKQ